MSWIWATAAVAVLWWPDHMSGPLDGAPLDTLIETVGPGLVVPVLWWFDRRFFLSPLARIAVAALVVLKIGGAFFTQDGWCVRFDPPAPIVRHYTGRPHSWDVRADWRAPDPTCSAVMTTGYAEFKKFPVWFFNMPPPDDNLPVPTDRPPYATLGMTVIGFIDAGTGGLLEIVTGPGMDMTVMVDGQEADHTDPLSHRIQLDSGIHFVQASATLTGNQWRFMPSWNRTLLGSAGFPTATIARPTAIDRTFVRAALRWSTTILIALLVLAWTVSALSAWSSPAMIAWVGVASLWLAYVAPRVGNQFVTTNLARWSIAALAAAAMVPVADKFRNLRGLFVLAGIPWLVFVGVTSIDHVGKFSLYAGGDDMWMFQRLAYRTYLEGFFLEGGQVTFHHQPLYRWIAGGLHMIFGDSSIGEFFWDGACFLALALFAGEATRRLAGFGWGLAATALTLTLIVWGPTWGFLGVGLSENSSAGLICMAALAAITAETWPAMLVAGVLATLGYYTRLNNLPMALAVSVFAIPLAVQARDALRLARWRRDSKPAVALAVITALIVGNLLLALRTWHYTGIFSVTHGTLYKNLSLWQPELTWVQQANSLVSSAMMVLTMNDPPRMSFYSIPMLVAAALSLGALAGIKGLRRLSFSLVLFFLAGVSGALIARGSAYSGRFSTILVGATGAITVSAIAMAVAAWKGRTNAG